MEEFSQHKHHGTSWQSVCKANSAGPWQVLPEQWALCFAVLAPHFLLRLPPFLASWGSSLLSGRGGFFLAMAFNLTWRQISWSFGQWSHRPTASKKCHCLLYHCMVSRLSITIGYVGTWTGTKNELKLFTYLDSLIFGLQCMYHFTL